MILTFLSPLLAPLLPPVRRERSRSVGMRRQALMLCQIATYVHHRSLDNPYILLQLVKFSPRRQIRNLSLYVTDRLKHSIQLPVLVLHKHAEMVDCFCYFIPTTSLAPFQRNGKRYVPHAHNLARNQPESQKL
jgi:hypothetical protein